MILGKKSRYRGYHFIGSNADTTQNNTPVLAIAKIIKNAMSSNAEPELGAIFYNARECVSERTTLKEMGHPQPPIESIKDNQAVCNIPNKNCKQTRSKAIDMNYYRVRDRIEQGQFKLTWKAGFDFSSLSTKSLPLFTNTCFSAE